MKMKILIKCFNYSNSTLPFKKITNRLDNRLKGNKR